MVQANRVVRQRHERRHDLNGALARVAQRPPAFITSGKGQGYMYRSTRFKVEGAKILARLPHSHCSMVRRTIAQCTRYTERRHRELLRRIGTAFTGPA